MRRVMFAACGLALAGTAAGCSVVIGLDQFRDGICTPGALEDCAYSGPDGTKGVGICKTAVKVCDADGQAWGACAGEVLPKPTEDCATPVDDNCDGQVNEASAGCCKPGESQACYPGPAGTEGVGICKAGTQVCGKDGKTYGDCAGEVGIQPETCADTLDNDCDGRECVEWNEVFGDGTSQLTFASALDGQDNIYLAGYFEGAIKLGKTTLMSMGSGDAFLMKLDPAGKPLWGKQFGGTEYQDIDAIAIDPQGNVFVGGRSAEPIDLGGGPLPAGLFAAEFTSAGSYVWGQGLTTMSGCVGSDSYFYSLACTSQGDVIAGGYYCGTLDVGDGAIPSKGRDAFVVKLISASKGSGKVSDGGWSKTFGDAQLQEVDRVAVDFQGNIIVGASFQGQIDFGEGIVTSSTGYDVIVIKLDSTGKALSYITIGGMGDQQLTDMALDATGGPIVSGLFTTAIGLDSMTVQAVGSGPNGFVARYGADFSYAWSKLFPSASSTVAVDGADNVILSGVFNTSLDLGGVSPLSTTSGSFAIFLAKLSSNGSLSWQREFSSDSFMLGFGGRVTPTTSGELILAGGLSGTANFGGGPLTSAGLTDILVAKFGK